MANNGLFLAFIGVIVWESTCQSHVVPRPPEDVHVSDISNTSLQLSWTPITDEPERILFYVIRYKPKESDDSYKEEIGNMAETLRVRDLRPGTEYEFSVVGHNSKARGIPSVPIFAKTLDGTDAPDPPADVRILDVTDTTVQLFWSPPHMESGNILYYNVMYKPKASNQNYSVITGISTHVYTIENLIPYTVYEFSVVAVNSIGSGAPSAPVFAELYGADPATPPGNIQARPLSSTSVVIQWDPPKELIGKILAYQVYFSKHLNSPIAEWNMQRVGNNHLTTMTGLAPRTVYAVIIQAFSNRGQGPYSSPVQVKTQRGVPSQPSRIVVTEISRSEVSLYWSDPSRAGEEIMNYELYWEDNYTNEFYHESLNNTDTYKITGLHPDTIYSVWVAARNVYGEGAPTPPIQVKTEEFSPSRPKKVSAKAISSTAIKVKWKRPSKTLQKGLIEGYRIYVEEHHNQQNTGSALKMFYVEDEETKEFNVTGLQPDTYYSIQVAATTRKGDGALGEQVSVITTGGVPTKPELRVRLTDDKPHFVADATWHPPVYIHGNLRSYRMIHGRTDILEKEQMEVQILDPSTERLTIHNLDYGAHYAFYLSGKNDFGWGKETVVHLKTPEAAPNTPPQNVTFRLQSPTAFVVSWLPPPLQNRNGKIVQYSVQLHNVPEKTTSKRTTADTKMLFTDLSEDTEYMVQVLASTWKGSGPPSNPLTVFTPRFVLPAPIDVSAFATSDKTVEVSWNSAPYLYNALGFRVLFTTESVQDLDQWDYKSVPFTESAELTGLETNATYAIMVAAETNNGLGRLSDVLLVRVEATDVPTELIADDISAESMSLSWEKPSKLNPIKYQISYTAYKEFYNSNGELEKLRVPSYTVYLDAHVFPDAHVTEYALLDLMPFTSYHVNVTAITFDKFPRPPAKLIATTAIAAPKMVDKPGIYGFGGEITVTLPKASEEYGPISHYYVAVVPAIYATRDPEEYSTGELGAVPLDKIGPYIAAKFTYISVPSEFPLGDGKFYEGYLNRELKRDEEYRVFVRAVVDSPLKNLYSSSPFSDVISWDLSGELEHLTYVNEKTEVCKSNGNTRTDLTWIVFLASFLLLFKMNDS